MKSSNFDINKVIESLEGSCDTIDDVIESLYPGMDEDDLTGDDYNAIDNQIFRCPTCGWWFDLSEQSDNEEDTGDCENCYEDE